MTHVILLDAFGMGFYTLAKDLIVKFRSTIKRFKCDIFEKTFKQGNC